MEEYKVKFFTDPQTGRSPVEEYLDKVSVKDRAKISKYIEFLRENKGVPLLAKISFCFMLF